MGGINGFPPPATRPPVKLLAHLGLLCTCLCLLRLCVYNTHGCINVLRVHTSVEYTDLVIRCIKINKPMGQCAKSLSLATVHQ